MPATATNTYDQTVGIRLDVEDLIFTQDASDVPLQGTYNGTETPAGPQRSLLGHDFVTEKKFSWNSEGLLLPRSKVATAYTDVATTVVVTAGDGIKFQEGHIIRNGDDVFRVTSVSVDTLTVTRAYGGATAAAGSVGDTLIGIGTTLPEGSDPKAPRWKDRVDDYNFTQIFGPYAVTVTGTEETILKYGVTSEFDHQSSNRVKEIVVEYEQALMYGRRFDDATNKWRSMGGLYFYIASNIDSSTTTITLDKIGDQAIKVFDNGGAVDTLIVGGLQARRLSGLDASLVTISRADRVRGQVVDAIVTQYGIMDVLMTRHARPGDAFGIQRSLVEMRTLRPLMVEPLAKTGDSWKSQIVMEKSLAMHLQNRAFRFSALT